MRHFPLFLIIFSVLGCRQSCQFNQTEFYSNGLIKVNSNYTDGVKNGNYEEYYSNGNLKYKASFQNGLQKDTTEFYEESGQLKYLQTWEDGIPKKLYQITANE
jgi:antitoxin component YwqK of YwqJK toxin-antitoxin module